MTSVFSIVESAFVSARDASDGNTPVSALLIVEALVDAGVCVDDQHGEASLEAKVEAAFLVVKNHHEADWAWASEAVTDAVIEALGIGVAA